MSILKENKKTKIFHVSNLKYYKRSHYKYVCDLKFKSIWFTEQSNECHFLFFRLAPLVHHCKVKTIKHLRKYIISKQEPTKHLHYSMSPYVVCMVSTRQIHRNAYIFIDTQTQTCKEKPSMASYSLNKFTNGMHVSNEWTTDDCEWGNFCTLLSEWTDFVW